MVTHYSSNGTDLACGRNNPGAVIGAAPEDVSCKSCLKALTKGEGEARPAPKKTTPSLAEIRQQRLQAAKVKSKVRFNFKASWRERLAQLPGRSRMPRGMGGVQRFVG